MAFENSRISKFKKLVTLTLTLDRVILHTVVHHSSTSTYMPNFIEIEKTSVDGRTDLRTDGRIHGRIFETGFIRSTRSKSRPKMALNVTLLAFIYVILNNFVKNLFVIKSSDRSIQFVRGHTSRHIICRGMHLLLTICIYNDFLSCNSIPVFDKYITRICSTIKRTFLGMQTV